VKAEKWELSKVNSKIKVKIFTVQSLKSVKIVKTLCYSLGKPLL
jgi:hypothetical protein